MTLGPLGLWRAAGGGGDKHPLPLWLYARTLYPSQPPAPDLPERNAEAQTDEVIFVWTQNQLEKARSYLPPWAPQHTATLKDTVSLSALLPWLTTRQV